MDSEPATSTATVVLAEVFSISVPLVQPIRWEGGMETETGFVLLRLTDSDGFQGVAEVAAKPTWNGTDPETLAMALRRLVLPMCRRMRATDLRAPTTRLVENNAARALADNALWDLSAARTPRAPQPVPVSWTLTRGRPEQMAQEAAHMAAEHGFGTFKIKGGQGLGTDIAAVTSVRAALGDGAVLYVDANGAVPFDQAPDYVAMLGDSGIVALEDPCNLKPDRRLAGLQSSTSLPILVDFNLDGVSSARSFLDAGARGLSVKPSRFGVGRCLDMAGMGQKAGATLVIGLFGESAAGAITLLSMHEALAPASGLLPAEAAFHLGFRDHYLYEPPRLDAGFMTRPDTPGLAAAIDWARFARLGGISRYSFDLEEA